MVIVTVSVDGYTVEEKIVGFDVEGWGFGLDPEGPGETVEVETIVGLINEVTVLTGTLVKVP